MTLREAAWILYGITMPAEPPRRDAQAQAQEPSTTAMHCGWRLGEVYDADDRRRTPGVREDGR